MTAPLAVYGAALRRAAGGKDASLDLLNTEGEPLSWLDAATWSGDLRPGDPALLGRCRGATLDVGCGPGRLAAALALAGHATLGVDISPEAVRQARRRGAPAIRGCVFDPLPGEGGWRSILLVDGNIGIGGDPARLLRRCGGLLGARGAVLAEVCAPGELSWSSDVVLRDDERQSTAFPWASVSADDVAGLAYRCGFGVRDMWTEAGRWFAHLTLR